jgi:hypothetical protein
MDQDATVPQVNDAELETGLIRALSVVGQIGKLRVLDIVIPTISLGDVIQPTVEVRSPSFRSTDVFSNGVLVGAAANALLADTGALAEGIYDVQYYLASSNTAANTEINFEHRNAANTATLAIWSFIFYRQTSYVTIPWVPNPIAYEIASNERIRLVIGSVGMAAGTQAVGTIFARRRT